MFLQAQEFRGLILGRVTDPSSAVVPNATITAKGPQQTYMAKSNASGDFTIPFVLPGTYDVTAEAPGFRKAVRTRVTVDVAQKLNLNFTLEVGAVTETVTVLASPATVNTADASGGTVMDSEKTQNLPLNGRQVYMLMTLTPGVRFTTTSFGPSGNSGTRGWDQTNAYVINGVINNLNQFTLNGAPISQQTSTARGAWFIAPNVDAVEEFKIQTNNYDASYGRTGGGTVNVVLKNGTNRFHGTAFDFFRNSVFDANYFQLNQQGQPKGFHNQHQFGGTIGGPIKKDKTFFFFSFEGWREVLPVPAVVSTPSASVRPQADGSVDLSVYLAAVGATNGIYDPFHCATTNPDGTCATRTRFVWNGKSDVIPPATAPGCGVSYTCVSPIGLKILSLYPLPNRPGEVNNRVGSSGGIYRYNQPIVRIDHTFSERTRLYGMFTWWSGTEYRNTQGFSGTDVNPAILRGNINNYRAFLSQIVDVTHTFSPTLFGDLRFSFGRATDRAPNGALAAGLAKLTPADLGLTNYPVPPTTDQNLAPSVSLNNTFPTIIGNSVFSDFGHPPLNESYELSPTITHVIGKHNLRYGGQFMQVYAIPCCGNGNTANGPGGGFTFRGTFTQQNPTRSNKDGASLASLILGIPGDQNNSAGNIPFNLPIYEGYPYFALYLQDDWKILPNVTLNLGLRWDAELSPDERHNRLNAGFCFACRNPITDRITFPPNNKLPNGATMPNPIVGGFNYTGNGLAPYDTQWNHWGPKVGVSWGINKKTVLRGGYGVNWAFAFELGGNTTFTATTNAVGNNLTTPTTFFRSGNPYPNGLNVPVGSANGLLSSLGDQQSFDQRNRKITKVQQYSLGIQRELPGQILLDVAYVGTYSSNVRVGTEFDHLAASVIAQCGANTQFCDQGVPNPFFGVLPASSTLGSQKTVEAWRLMVPYPQFNGSVFSNTEPVGFTNYNSLQVKVNKRLSGGGLLLNGLSFLSSFTWSRTMRAANFLNNGPDSCPGCQDDQPNYRVDDNDRTLDFAFSGIWGLPIGKGALIGKDAHGMLGQFINGWSLDWIFTAASGTPISLPNANPFNCPQNNNSYLPPPGKQSYSEWLYNETPSCFSPVPRWLPIGITPRVSYIRAPYAPQLAMAMGKKFAIRESMDLQFRAEAFNLTNTPIFGGPSTGSPNQGVTINKVGIPPGSPGYCSGYGCIGSTQQNFPRQIQLSLKVLF